MTITVFGGATHVLKPFDVAIMVDGFIVRHWRPLTGMDGAACRVTHTSRISIDPELVRMDPRRLDVLCCSCFARLFIRRTTNPELMSSAGAPR